jgi:hypothetical protein
VIAAARAHEHVPACAQERRRSDGPDVLVLVPIDGEVFAFDEASPPKFIKHRNPKWRIAWIDGQAAKSISLPSLLRTRRERPSYNCTTNKRDDVTP